MQHLPGTRTGKARDTETHPASLLRSRFTNIPRDPLPGEMPPVTSPYPDPRRGYRDRGRTPVSGRHPPTLRLGCPVHNAASKLRMLSAKLKGNFGFGCFGFFFSKIWAFQASPCLNAAKLKRWDHRSRSPRQDRQILPQGFLVTHPRDIHYSFLFSSRNRVCPRCSGEPSVVSTLLPRSPPPAPPSPCFSIVVVDFLPLFVFFLFPPLAWM